VALPEARLLQRYRLATGERLLSVPLPYFGRPTVVSMGASSSGPLFLARLEHTGSGGHAALEALDPATCRPWAPETFGQHAANYAGPIPLSWASADGGTVAWHS